MRRRDIWRIAALIALILAALGLALGACMAKRSSESSPSPTTTPDTGSAAGGGTDRGGSPSPHDNRERGPDAGTETRANPRKPSPPPPVRSQPGKATPKTNKGMLGQMRLQDGD